MRILDKMLYKELISAFFAVLIVLLLITFGAEATKLLARAVEGKVPVAAVGQLLLLRLPDALELVLPLAVLIGVMLTFGRLYQEQQMAVLHACGIAPGYFRSLLLKFLLPLTLIGMAISHYFIPYAQQYQRQLLLQQEVVSPVAALIPGKFNALPGNRGTFYAKSIAANGDLEEVWVTYREGENDWILLAPRGQFVQRDQQMILRLQEGWRYQSLHLALEQGAEAPLSRPLEVQRFALFEGVIPQLNASEKAPKEEELYTWQLWGSDSVTQQAILQWRLAAPFGLLVLGLIGLQLSRSGPRQGRFTKVFLAIVLFILFNQLLVAGRNAIEAGYWPAQLTLLWIPLLFLWVGLGGFAALRSRLSQVLSVRWFGKAKAKATGGSRDESD
ncbi:MAG: LPS export ABC transporter permease LptF [Thiotrichales bacterium]|nr:LPS export ABC transporter permease LptF [Thiotrichales bacterium]